MRFASACGAALSSTVLLAFLACGDTEGGDTLGGDQGIDAAAPVGPFCPSEPAHKLCADFDTGAVEKGWSSTDFRGEGKVVTAPDQALSPPSVAAATGKAGGSDLAYLLETLPGPVGAVTVALQLRAEQAGDDAGGATVLVVQGSPNHSVTFNIGKTGENVGCQIAEFGQSNQPLSTASCKSGWGVKQWVHLSVRVTYTPPTGRIVVVLNHGDEPILDAPLTTTPGGDASVSLGVRPYQGTGDYRVLFDNVAVD